MSACKLAHSTQCPVPVRLAVRGACDTRMSLTTLRFGQAAFAAASTAAFASSDGAVPVSVSGVAVEIEVEVAECPRPP